MAFRAAIASSWGGRENLGRILKAAVRRCIAEIYFRTGQYRRHLRGRILILTYHRVIPEAERTRYYVQAGMYVTPDVFEAHMRFVREQFEVLSLSQLLESWETGRLRDMTPYCVITFDDGWLDNYAHAFPVLRSLGMPATMFLATGFVGTEEWFWPDTLAYILERRGKRYPASDFGRLEHDIEAAIGRWKEMPRVEIEDALAALLQEWGGTLPRTRLFVNWDEVAEMGRHGISFGSHSVSHPILTRESPADVEDEIQHSLRVLQERAVNVVPAFCYPNGDYSAAIMSRVQAAGYRAALSSDHGWEAHTPGNLFALRRVGIHNDVTATTPLLALRLGGWNPRSRAPFRLNASRPDPQGCV